MGGGSKQTTNQQTATTTTLPEWMTSAGQDLYSKAAGMKPVGAYTAPMAAGSTPNQTAATAAAAGSAGNWQGDINTARAMTTAAASAPPASVTAQSVNPTMMTAAGQGYTGYQAAGSQSGPPQVAAGSVNGGTFDGNAAAQYMNPYTANVQANTLTQMDRQNQIDHQQLNDGVEAAKAFGGSRQGLLESEMAKNQAQTKQDYIDKSNSDAYSNAQSQFNTDRAAQVAANTGNADRSLTAQTTNASLLDQLLGRMDTASQFTAGAKNTAAGANADRRQQAGQFNASTTNSTATDNANRSFDASKTNASLDQTMLDRLMQGGAQSASIGSAASGLSTNDIRNLSSTGAIDQQTQQTGLDAAYNEYLRAGNAPLNNIKDIMSILSGAPRNVTTTGTESGTTTTKSNPGLLNTLLAAGQVAASAGAFSDPRLKKDVGLIERLANGLGIYRFRYLWDRSSEPAHVGVMADEVASIIPEALGPIVAGFMTVNYAKLGELLR